jgi:hypothetical protein
MNGPFHTEPAQQSHRYKFFIEMLTLSEGLLRRNPWIALSGKAELLATF